MRYRSWSNDNQCKSSVSRRRLANYQANVQQKAREDAAKELAAELRKLEY